MTVPRLPLLPPSSRESVVARVLCFAVGLLAGYVLSGLILGPGVLAVLIGIETGMTVAAIFGRVRPEH